MTALTIAAIATSGLPICPPPLIAGETALLLCNDFKMSYRLFDTYVTQLVTIMEFAAMRISWL
jgi:hypothetical protein